MEPAQDVKRHTPTRSAFHEAPEVAYEAPILAHSESDGLQSAYPASKEAPYYSSHPVLAPEPEPRKSRTWLWIVGAVVAALIGLGAGIGIGYAVGRGSSNDKSSYTPTQTVTVTSYTTSPTTSATATATASSAAVTSGTTGIAAFSCNTSAPDNTYTSPSAPNSDPTLLNFTEECYIDYVGGSSTADSSGTVTDLAARTVYSFQSCMDQCVLYSQGLSGGKQACLGVTYNANLTASVLQHGGNCWLKSARGKWTSHGDDGVFYASAYLTSEPFNS